MHELPTFDHNILPLLPSLLTPITSLPLHNLPRIHHNNRIPNNIFTISIQRKLRLPIIHTPLRCKCNQPIDPYGDHVFSCSRHSKIRLHNATTAAIHATLTPLLVLTGTRLTPHDTLLEPTNLIPESPLRRPADIAIRLSPPKHISRLSHAFKMHLIDVTFTPPTNIQTTINNPSSQPADLKTLATLADRPHLTSMKAKFISTTTRLSTSHDLIQAINSHQYILTPFTIDPFGRFGYIAQTFLGSQHPWFPSTKPPWTREDLPHNPASYEAYQNSLKATSQLLSSANDFWQTNHPKELFGHSYHTPTPLIWFQQAFGINLIHSLATHLLTAITASTNPTPQTSPKFGPKYPRHTLHSTQHHTLHSPSTEP